MAYIYVKSVILLSYDMPFGASFILVRILKQFISLAYNLPKLPYFTSVALFFSKLYYS